jgi:histidinol-phosphatase (PHP family)
MKRAGFDIGYDAYDDALREIFRTAMRNGIGLEVNTSGLRQGLGATIPAFRQIRLYRELGGEIITVGSDAHYPKDVGAGIADGYKLLREAAFDMSLFSGTENPISSNYRRLLS